MWLEGNAGKEEEKRKKNDTQTDILVVLSGKWHPNCEYM